jgi:uncharacterized protein
MKKLLATFVFMCSCWSATAAEPSAASIEKLLDLTRAESLMDAVYNNMEQGMRQGMAQASAGKPMTDAQRRSLEIAPAKLMEVFRQEFSWSMLKPMYIQIYKDSFDQDDIDSLNAFYASKAGQAFISKMPVVMQRSMTAVQERMAPLSAKMVEAMKLAISEAEKLK